MTDSLLTNHGKPLTMVFTSLHYVTVLYYEINQLQYFWMPIPLKYKFCSKVINLPNFAI